MMGASATPRFGGVYIKVIDVLSWPVWLVLWLWRHKTVRSILITGVLASVGLAQLFGWGAVLAVWSMVARFGFAAVFMIAQFAFLFMFLSSTKTIERYPGDEAMFTFGRDYFGNEYLVETSKQWVDSLNREGKARMDALGAEPIHGILYEGPPGTGKTLLAQCLASYVSAAFFGTAGADFQAMFIGVGPMKMMRMYSKARKAANEYGAAIVFVDEADAIGGNRGGVSGNRPVAGGMAGGMFGGGGLGVLSKWLTELDGVKELGLRDQVRNRMRSWLGVPEIRRGIVLTIAATNRIDAMDPALLRPGRLDKIIQVDRPDRLSRRKIIEGYLGKVRTAEHRCDHCGTLIQSLSQLDRRGNCGSCGATIPVGFIDIDRLTDDTQGVTPAQLASAIQRGAARYAINAGHGYISQGDIENALQEDLVGLANPIADFDPPQRRQVAVHEAGHAVAHWVLSKQVDMGRITHASIIRRGAGILGYVRDVEAKETYARPLDYYAAKTQVALAGHYAVELVMGRQWTGATSDFDHVRGYLRYLALMGKFGGIPFDVADPLSNERIAKRADDWLQAAITGTKKLLEENETLVVRLADALERQDELNSEEVHEILDG